MMTELITHMMHVNGCTCLSLMCYRMVCNPPALKKGNHFGSSPLIEAHRARITQPLCSYCVLVESGCSDYPTRKELDTSLAMGWKRR